MALNLSIRCGPARGRLAVVLLALVAAVAAAAAAADVSSSRGDPADPACGAQATEQRELTHQRATLLGLRASIEAAAGHLDTALRYAAEGTRLDMASGRGLAPPSIAPLQLAAISQMTRERLVLSGHADAVVTARFSRDGTRVVTASEDGTARVWDARTGAQLLLLDLGDKGESAAFSADGTRIVTTSDDRNLILWNAGTGARLKTFPIGVSLTSAEFGANDTTITVLADSEYRTLDAADGRVLSRRPNEADEMDKTYLSPDRTRMVEINVDSSDVVLSNPDGRQAKILKGHAMSMLYAAFSSDGSRFATLSEDLTPRVWRSDTGDLVAVLAGHDEKATFAAFSPDGSRLVTASTDKTARIWRVTPTPATVLLRAPPSKVAKASSPPVPVKAAFDPAGTHVVTVLSDGEALIWDATSGRHLFILRTDEPVGLATFGVSGAQIVTVSAVGVVRRWDTATGAAREGSWRVPSGTLRDLSPDGARLLTTGSDGSLTVFDAVSGKVLATRRLYQTAARFAHFASDGQRVVSASGNDETTGSVVVWDPSKPDAPIVIAYPSVWDADVSRDGRTLVAGTIAGPIGIWALSARERVGFLEGPDSSSVVAVGFSPDGTRVVTTANDMAVRLWDVATRRQIVQLDTYESTANAFAFDRDGRHLVVAANDGAAHVYDVDAATSSPKDLLAETCRHRLPDRAVMSRTEMREVGYLDTTPAVDACRGVR